MSSQTLNPTPSFGNGDSHAPAASTTATRPKSHPNNFDSLRLIFAVIVILSHSFPLSTGSNATEPLSVLTHGQVNFGNIGVWAFFVISGFLITQSWQRSPKVGKFLKRRIGRIYPGFIVAALVGAFAVVPLAAGPGQDKSVSLLTLVFQTLRLRGFETGSSFPHNPLTNVLNGSLWSVQYEFWCYLGILALGLAGLLTRRWVVVTLFAAVIALHLGMDVTGWAPAGSILGQIFGYPPFWAIVLPFYLAGTLFHLYGGPSLLRTPWIFAAAVLLIASNFIPHGLIVTAPTCGAYLLMALAYVPWLHPLNLGRFGDFSYGTYLYAFPIQQLLVLQAHGSISPWLLFAEATPLTLLAGALSWFLVERHFLLRTAKLRHEGLLPPAPSKESTLAADTSNRSQTVIPEQHSFVTSTQFAASTAATPGRPVRIDRP